MSSRFVIDPSGRSEEKPVVAEVPKVKTVLPFGSTILVEMLNANEALGTRLAVRTKEASDLGAPQAYVLALGPKLNPDSGIKVGDRVILQGVYVPVPTFLGETRKRGIVELHNVKAILEEFTNDEE